VRQKSASRGCRDCGARDSAGGMSRKIVHRPPGAAGEGKSAMLLSKTNCLPEGNTL
jgi:hypothetical protein